MEASVTEIFLGLLSILTQSGRTNGDAKRQHEYVNSNGFMQA
jgi:hypothetical protein